MKQNDIIREVYEELGLQDPDWIPEEYERFIYKYADSFAGKNQLPIKYGEEKSERFMYPIDKQLVRNRVVHQLMNALMNGVEVPETYKGVDFLITKNPQYPIMLNGKEERVLCKAMQDSLKLENAFEIEETRNVLANVAITFLSPRIRYIYRRFEKAVGACKAYEDVAQEMVLAMFKMLDDFNFERTTAGITKDFLNMRMFRAINLALSANRASSMAHETWQKVSQFVNHPEDHRLSREEVKKKYHCSAGLVEVMFTFVENGSLEVSMDYTPTDKSSSSHESNYSSFGDSVPSKDYDTEELELDLLLKGILPPEQYAVVTLKMKGFNHRTIANIMGYPNKRKSQYVFICARRIIQNEFNVDIEEYSKGRAVHLRRLEAEARKAELDAKNVDDLTDDELDELCGEVDLDDEE